MAIGATGDLFPLSILSGCSVTGTSVGSLPYPWEHSLGGCISTWVSSAGGSARMALVINVFAVPGSWVPKPDASSKAIADMARAGRVLNRSVGKTHKLNLEL